MWDVISFILIFVSLGVITAIVVRKFSVLASLDVENIKEEREAKFKEQIISNRLKRNYRKYSLRFVRIITPLITSMGEFFKNIYKKLVSIKEEEEKNIAVESNMDDDEGIEKLFREADELVTEEDLTGAEKKYIEIIAIESKNIMAFKKLAKLYFERKDYTEAKQSLEHAIRLTENSSDFSGNEAENLDEPKINLSAMYFDLALISKATDIPEEAMQNINKSLSLEPNNPRYLDTKFDICIMNEDKEEARLVFEKMRESNPENQKLPEMEEQLSKLAIKTESLSEK